MLKTLKNTYNPHSLPAGLVHREGDTMKETIKLYRLKGGWVARFSDPTITELFGTDTIPTPYLYAADSETVLAEITKLNPNCQVTLASNNA